MRDMDIAVLLHNVRSTHNVGSILRTADAVGVSHVYLTGYTPTPVDRFGRARKDIAKTALGAECSVPWTYQKSANSCIASLRKEGWRIVGVEQDLHATDYRTMKKQYKVLFVFGNEVRGLSKELRALCDELVEIPMRGKLLRDAAHPHHGGGGKESLNIAVAAGIVLFETARPHSK